MSTENYKFSSSEIFPPGVVLVNDNNTSTTLWNSENDKPVKNGCICPNCGEELYDTNPSIILTSHPAQKNVHCNTCNYKGYRRV